MKVLIVGSDSKFAIERSYRKHMAESNELEEVTFFAAKDKFLKYYNKSIARKVLFRIGLSEILKRINKELIEIVLIEKPNIIFIFKGMEIFPETLQYFKQQRIKLVNYNPDNPFIFSGGGSGNKNVTNSISLYDLHFTYDSTVKEKIETTYSIPCKILPFGFDIPETLYKECVKEEEVIKVCFLGNPDNIRASFIKKLIDKGVAIDLYGNGWHKFITHTNATIYNSVYGDELWKTLRKYRVQLNIMRLHNPTSHNMRSFEVPGIGGIILAPDTIDHRTYFEVDKEIFLYKNVEECVYQINLLLKKPINEIELIRKNARTKSIKAKYDYESRSAFVVNILREL